MYNHIYEFQNQSGLFQDFTEEGEANFKGGGGGQSHTKYRESQFPRGGGGKSTPAPP
jgi:hypothetical protein